MDNHQFFQERNINTQFRMETEILVSYDDMYYIFRAHCSAER